VLIVGAGQAGATAAAALRGFGYRERILIVGLEHQPPYERPPLSKAMLAGAGSVGDILIHPASFHAEKAIELLAGVEVASLDTATHTALLGDGTSIRYQHCLIATGGRPRTVAGLAPGQARVHYLRSITDALRLRDEMRRHRSVLILGGGFLGLEVASTARAMGLSVTVLESAHRVLNRAVPQVLSTWLQQRIARSGLALRLNVQCQSVFADSDGVSATLASGEQLSADLVVVAVGLEPEVDIARRAGIPINAANRGIGVDARCATSAPDVFAAGDCSSQHHPFIGAEVRLESWQSANEQARLAAAAIAGVPTESLAAPWFWSDQFACNLQILGVPVPGLTYRCRGTMDEHAESPNFILLGVSENGQILHAVAVNAGRDLRQLKALVDNKAPCDPAALCDTASQLRQQVRAALAGVPQPAFS
jgi:3-phenylpropionate/trans-cinnamate dioxygenase ferredoxin reductase subunit